MRTAAFAAGAALALPFHLLLADPADANAARIAQESRAGFESLDRLPLVDYPAVWAAKARARPRPRVGQRKAACFSDV